MCVLLVGLTGCASVNLNAGFSEVGAGVEDRAATKVVWNRGTELGTEAAAAKASEAELARDGITVDAPDLHKRH